MFCSGLPLFLSAQAKNGEVNLALTGDIQTGIVSTYHTGLNVIIKNNVQQQENLMNRYDPNPIFGPVLKPNPDLGSFMKRGIHDILRGSGLR
jgi:hypothetical protein